MCSLCRRNPCSSRCPNAPEPAVFDYCCECQKPILIGDDYYDLGGDRYCEDCVSNGFSTAEED